MILGTEPYKGVDSYQPEDAELFFGRDQDAERLLAIIQASRFTLLHARSGAGKTSLLNARIIPHLEARGITPVRILLQNEPIESVQVATLLQVLPPPAAEVESIEKALEMLPRNKKDREDGKDPTFSALLKRFDKLDIDDVRRRDLIAPIEIGAGLLGGGDAKRLTCTPYFRRVLRMSLEVSSYADHLAALSSQARDRRTTDPRINPDTRISELLGVLRNRALVDDYTETFEWLHSRSELGLRQFFEKLVDGYGRFRESFSLVLIFDQFEELFTRFVDPGPTARKIGRRSGSWRKRREFIRELKDLYWTDHGPAFEVGGVVESRRVLPLRYVISIRDEYIAQLSHIRSFVVDLEKATLHLGFLKKKNAVEAIIEPALRFGYEVTKSCYSTIVASLTKEDDYVEPAHIQIVCERLWRELRERREEKAQGQNLTKIDDTFFQDLGGPEEILKSYFDDFLKRLNTKQRSGILEMLGLLITPSGTRNIVAEEEVVGAGTRHQNVRSGLLEILSKHKVVRVEWRLEGSFVEITHEFLIHPIQQAISKDIGRYENLTWFQFHEFMDSLPSTDEQLEVLEMLAELVSPEGARLLKTEEDLVRVDFRRVKVRKRILGRLEQNFIVERTERDKVIFFKISSKFFVRPIQVAITRAMHEDEDYKRFGEVLPALVSAKRSDFRSDSAKLLTPELLEVLEKHLDRLEWGYEGTELMFRSALVAGESLESLKGWARRLEEGDATWSAQGLLDKKHLNEQMRSFAFDELSKINDARKQLDLTPEAIEQVLRSELLMAGEAHRDDVFFWAQQWVKHES